MYNYIVLDNRRALFARHATLTAYKASDEPTLWSEHVKASFERRHAGLKKPFVFLDFDIAVRPCGTPNGSSSPNIIICSELIRDTQSAGVPSACLHSFMS